MTGAEEPKERGLHREMERSVSFSQDVYIREITHIRDIPEPQFESMWFTPIEFSTIRAGMKYALSMFEHGGKIMEQKHPEMCWRGLECRTREGCKRKKKNRLRASRALFAEQDRQFGENDELDHDRLAQVYKKRTEQCARDANSLGMMDESDARWEGNDHDDISLGEPVEKDMGKTKTCFHYHIRPARGGSPLISPMSTPTSSLSSSPDSLLRYR